MKRHLIFVARDGLSRSDAAPDLLDHAGDFEVRLSLAEQKALHFSAALADEVFELIEAFDALGRRAKAEVSRQADRGSHDGAAFGVPEHFLNERLIDLDLVELERAKIAQAGIPGPEIVERDSHARSRSRPRINMFCALFRNTTLSVISSSSRSAGNPEALSAMTTAEMRPVLRN